MQSETEEELALENKLSNSDLTGLLKAAKLAEFKPDLDSRVVSAEFEKSASLFDLVRSNLDIDGANSLRELEVFEEKNDEDPERGHQDQTDGLELDPTSDLTPREDPSTAHEPYKDIVESTEKEQSSDDITVDAAQSIDEDSEIFETDNFLKEEVTEPSEKDSDLLLENNEEYLAKIESLKIEFDEKLEAEKQNFTSAQSALLKAIRPALNSGWVGSSSGIVRIKRRSIGLETSTTETEFWTAFKTHAFAVLPKVSCSRVIPRGTASTPTLPKTSPVLASTEKTLSEPAAVTNKVDSSPLRVLSLIHI